MRVRDELPTDHRPAGVHRRGTAPGGLVPMTFGTYGRVGDGPPQGSPFRGRRHPDRARSEGCSRADTGPPGPAARTPAATVPDAPPVTGATGAHRPRTPGSARRPGP